MIYPTPETIIYISYLAISKLPQLKNLAVKNGSNPEEIDTLYKLIPKDKVREHIAAGTLMDAYIKELIKINICNQLINKPSTNTTSQYKLYQKLTENNNLDETAEEIEKLLNEQNRTT